MTLRIRLLGNVDISLNGKPLQLKGQKPVALLAYLLITGKAHTRQHLVDLLYNNETDDLQTDLHDPRAGLRWTLNQLRQMIGSDYLETNREQISFNFESDYWFDIDALLAGDLTLYRGELLAGVYVRDALQFMDWVVSKRAWLLDEYQRILTRQLEVSENKGDYQSVANLAHQLLQLVFLSNENSTTK